MPKALLRILIVIIITLVSGILGWVIGALIGGNYAEQLVFNGVRGYEATGQIGSLIGVGSGSISTSWFLFKKECF